MHCVLKKSATRLVNSPFLKTGQRLNTRKSNSIANLDVLKYCGFATMIDFETPVRCLEREFLLCRIDCFDATNSCCLAEAPPSLPVISPCSSEKAGTSFWSWSDK